MATAVMITAAAATETSSSSKQRRVLIDREPLSDRKKRFRAGSNLVESSSTFPLSGRR